MKRRRQVCLFGTSANPPTGDGGHKGIVKALSQTLGDRFDEIRVLPVYRHTFARKRNILASYEHRMNMCRCAFENIPKIVVSNAEHKSFQRMAAKLEMKNEEEIQALRVGTADLLDMLLEEEPDTDFSFCMGSDTFMDLTAWKWRRSKDVLKLLDGRLIVLERKGMTGNDQLRKRIATVNATDGRGNVFLLEIPSLQEVSSSSVRSLGEEDKLSYMVTPDVLAYMKKHRLYSFGDDNGND